MNQFKEQLGQHYNTVDVTITHSFIEPFPSDIQTCQSRSIGAYSTCTCVILIVYYVSTKPMIIQTRCALATHFTQGATRSSSSEAREAQAHTSSDLLAGLYNAIQCSS